MNAIMIPFMVILTFEYPSLQLIKSGITISPTFKILISNLNSNKAFENLSVDGKIKLLNENLLTIFRNYIPNKCDFCQLAWMADNIKKHPAIIHLVRTQNFPKN